MAIKLIDEAKKIGCDCVKFQSWDRDLFCNEVYERNSFLDDGRELEGNLEELVNKFALSFEQLKIIRSYCEKIEIDFSKVGKNKLFFDVIYNPKETNFLKQGKELGNLTENGKMMFIFQAQKSFQKWHNIIPKVDKEVERLLDD